MVTEIQMKSSYHNNLKIDGFSNINLITGQNRIGKTTLLCEIRDIDKSVKRITEESVYKNITISSTNEYLRSQSNDVFNNYKYIKEKLLKLEKIIELLKQYIVPELKTILLTCGTFNHINLWVNDDEAIKEYITNPRSDLKAENIKDEHIINVSGAMRKCLVLFSKIVYNENLIVIDELEDALHFDKYNDIIDLIISKAKQGVQFFISTHSREFAEFFANRIQANQYCDNLKWIHLYKNDKDIKCFVENFDGLQKELKYKNIFNKYRFF